MSRDSVWHLLGIDFLLDRCRGLLGNLYRLRTVDSGGRANWHPGQVQPRDTPSPMTKAP